VVVSLFLLVSFIVLARAVFLSVVTATSWSPASLAVPWASDFTSIAANQINVKTDPRLTVKAVGDGATDDTAAVAAAIALASSTGGGTVYFPASSYSISAPSEPSSASNAYTGIPLIIPSRVILLGDSPTTSVLLVNNPNGADETDWTGTWGGIDFQGASLVGMSNIGLTFMTASSTPAAALWNRGSNGVSEIFFDNVNIQLNNSRSIWINGTNDLLISNSTASITSNAGPLYFGEVSNSNVSILGNSFTYNFGRVHLLNENGLLVQGNSIIRNALGEDLQNNTAPESGGVELSLSQNVQFLNNTVETLNAPSNEVNDGEAIMSQNSTIPDALDAGTITAVTANTLTDTNATWGSYTAGAIATYPEIVVIYSGSAIGEWRTIQSVNPSTQTLTLTQPWSTTPPVGSSYALFVWTLSNATIEGNTLISNPNGIVLWDSCFNCTVQNNTLTNSRNIILRVVDQQTGYPESRRVHEVALNNAILNNTVSDTTGANPAQILLDAEAFASDSYTGMGMLNIQVGGNTINPNPSNLSETWAAEASQEGIFPCFLFGPAPVKSPVTTVFQDINYWSNSLSAPVTYVSGFLPLTTQACVTPSAPSN